MQVISQLSPTCRLHAAARLDAGDAPLLCEVHLWSEHLAVTADGSDKNFVVDLPPPPTEGLQGLYGQHTVYTYGKWAGCPRPHVTLD